MIKQISPDHIYHPVLALIGPTAIGKTELSLELSERFGCEIISVDSMQVYRYMDIGTAKIPAAERRGIPHHLIDIVNPDEQYDAVQFAADCLKEIKSIHARAAIPLLTGGTGLYLRSLKEGFFSNAPADPTIRQKLMDRVARENINVLHDELSLYDRKSASKIHPRETSRVVRALEVFLSTGVPLSVHQQNQPSPAARFKKLLTIGLTCARTDLYDRINQRTVSMVEEGLEGEVRSLLKRGYQPEVKSMRSIGYRHMVQYLSGSWTREELIETLARDTRRYAKRQYTWFNRDKSIVWFNRSEVTEVLNFTESWLNED